MASRLAERRRTSAREEWTSAAYDENLAANPQYRSPWWESPYHFLWAVIDDRIGGLQRSASVLEIGCGTGQLAGVLAASGLNDYCGFDFSPERIEIARTENPQLRFEVDDVYETDLLETFRYDTVVCTEVLEHLDGDVQILESINQGARVLASVPNFDAPGHLRWFRSPADVKKRYGRYFSDLRVSVHRKNDRSVLYLMDGRIR